MNSNRKVLGYLNFELITNINEVREYYAIPRTRKVTDKGLPIYDDSYGLALMRLIARIKESGKDVDEVLNQLISFNFNEVKEESNNRYDDVEF